MYLYNKCSSCILWFIYSTFWIPNLCQTLQRFKHLQSQISLSLTKLHSSGVSDSQDTTKLQIRAHNTQQSLTQLCVGNYTNLLNILAHISVAAMLRQSQPGHSPYHLQTLHRYSSNFNFSINFHRKWRHLVTSGSSTCSEVRPIFAVFTTICTYLWVFWIC